MGYITDDYICLPARKAWLSGDYIIIKKGETEGDYPCFKLPGRKIRGILELEGK